MNLEEERQALKAKKQALEAKIHIVKSRIDELPRTIEQLENELVAQALTETPDYQTAAVDTSALTLERKTLTAVLVQLNQNLLPMTSRLEGMGWAIADRETAAKNKALRESINKLKSQGKCPKTIRETLNLSQREYERLAA